MNNFEGLEAMNLEKAEFFDNRKGNSSASCSICFDLVVDPGERSIAKLQCGHEFHLDCIGSAFNAKGAMQCPNCRKVEKGRWLYASGHRSSSNFDFDAWVTEDFYDLSYSELPFGFQWCPLRGITQLASLIEEGESQLNSYHESMGNTTYGDHNNASSSTHVCPYLALHGHPHAMQSTPSSSSSDSVPENNTFPRQPANIGGGQPSADMINSHSFTNTEPRNHNWQQQHSIPFSFLGNATDQSASQFGPRLSRNDASSQQRLGSFVHPHSHHGSGARGGSNVAASIGPSVMGEMRSHSHIHTSRRHGNNHIHQQSPSSSPTSASFPPIRRSRPRALTLISSLSSTSSSAEIGGFYGFASVSSSANRTTPHQDAESMARHFDRFYGWGSREGLTPLPWIPPLEGESQWWGPFNPSQAPPQSGGSFIPRANITSERAGQSHRMPRPPPPYM